MKLSIVVPIYNLSDCLKVCLNSILNQNHSDIEVLLINDGSTDNSLEILKQYSHVKNFHIVDKINGGVGSARNTGIRKARGEYILFLDGDDYFCDNVLCDFLDVLRLNEADSYIFNYNYTSKDYQVINDSNNHLINSNFIITESRDLFEKVFINKSLSVWTGCVVVSKKLIDDYELQFNEEYKNGEDLNFFYKLLFLSKTVYCSSLKLTNYYQREGSISNSFNIRKFDAYYAMIDLYRTLNDLSHMEFCDYFRYDLSFTVYAYNYTLNLDNLIKSRVKRPMYYLNKQIDICYPGLIKEINNFSIKDILLSKNKFKLLIFNISPYLYRTLFKIFNIN